MRRGRLEHHRRAVALDVIADAAVVLRERVGADDPGRAGDLHRVLEFVRERRHLRIEGARARELDRQKPGQRTRSDETGSTLEPLRGERAE